MYRVESCQHNADRERKFRRPRQCKTYSVKAVRSSPKLESSRQTILGRLPPQRANMSRIKRGEVLMVLSNESILVILFVGLIAGWLAGKIVRGTGFGIIGDILVGIA